MVLSVIRATSLGLASMLLGCASLGETARAGDLDDVAPPPAAATIPDEVPRGDPSPKASDPPSEVAPDASLRVHVYGCGHAGCSGPTFELTLHADGRVEWVGIADVGLVGVDTQSIDPARLTAILETASWIRWDLVPANARESPRCGTDGLRLMWTFDDGDEISTGYDDRVREQPFSADDGPNCIAPELVPLRMLDAQVVRLLRELEYLGRPAPAP